MFYIFVDTQAFESEAFGFTHATSLIALANAVADGHVTVLLTEVTDNEVKEHIARRVTKSLERVKKEFVLQVLSIVDFDQWRKLDADTAAKNGVDEWERYKKDTAARMVSVDLAKPTSIMRAFFAQKPPFSKEKPNEFRDAFVLEALRVWAEHEDQQVIVVSGDRDHENTCDGVRLVHEQTIDDALARTLDDAALLEAARNELRVQAAVIRERLQEEMEGLPVSIIDDPDADVEGVSINGVDLDENDFELIEVRAGTVLLSGSAVVRVDVDATVADYDNGMRDEGDWVYLPYNSVTYSSDVSARLAVRIPIEDETPFKFGTIDPITVEDPRELDVDYTWASQVRKHWSEDYEPELDDSNTGTSGEVAKTEPEDRSNRGE